MGKPVAQEVQLEEVWERVSEDDANNSCCVLDSEESRRTNQQVYSVSSVALKMEKTYLQNSNEEVDVSMEQNPRFKEKYD